MLSRVANSLYWLARNMERVENNSRLISVNLVSRLEDVDPLDNERQDWQAILEINGFTQHYLPHHEQFDTKSVLEYLSFSASNPNSILNCIHTARENAKTVREVIPSEIWECLNGLHWEVKRIAESRWNFESISSLYQKVKDASLHLQGIINATVSRGDDYSFLQMGKYLERAEKTTRILDVYYHKKLDSPFNREIVDYHHWSSVLQSVSGFEAYLRKYHSDIKPERVTSFLLFDDAFPRSVLYSVQEVMKSFMDLEHGKIHHYSRSLYVVLGRLLSDLKQTGLQEIKEKGPHRFLIDILSRCNQIENAINKTYYLGEIEHI